MSNRLTHSQKTISDQKVEESDSTKTEDEQLIDLEIDTNCQIEPPGAFPFDVDNIVKTSGGFAANKGEGDAVTPSEIQPTIRIEDLESEVINRLQLIVKQIDESKDPNFTNKSVLASVSSPNNETMSIGGLW